MLAASHVRLHPMKHNPSNPFLNLRPLSYPCFSPETISLTSKYLSETIFNQLKERSTSSGFTLAHAVNSGMINPDSAMGIYAGDAECYKTFAPIFDLVIEAYHSLSLSRSSSDHQTDSFPQTHVSFPDPDPEKKYILSTRIRIARNLVNLPFTPIIDATNRKTVEKMIIEACHALPDDLKGRYYPINGKPLESNPCQCNQENEPFERSAISASSLEIPRFRKGDRFQEAAGINRDWPEARGIFESTDGRFSVWTNEEDHLRIISLRKDGDVGAVFRHLQKGVTALEKKLTFAWSKKLGYLTACPTNLGTGMRAGVHIRLPKLSHNPEKLKAMADALALQIRGTQGEKTEVEDGIFDISNRQRLGITEDTCCKVLYHGVCKMIEVEKGLCKG